MRERRPATAAFSRSAGETPAWAETVAGAFIRDVEARIAALQASPDTAAKREAEELLDVLRLGRLLLAGREVTL